MSKRCALAVMRTQPLHLGHTSIINHMVERCETVIIGLGSAQKKREKHDPWTIEERITMLRNVYADRIKIVPLNDLGLEYGAKAWCDYVLEKMLKLGLPDPTDYFTGSQADGSWYKSSFHHDGTPELGVKLAQADGKPFIKRKLHILDRDKNIYPPATEIRMFLELREELWRPWVPAVNHDFIMSTYPEEFKVPKK